MNLTVKINNIYRSRRIPVEIELPTTGNKLEFYMNTAKISMSTEPNCYVESIEGDVPALKVLEGKNVNIDELNFLARMIDSFDQKELNTFQAIVDTEKHDNLRHMINLYYNLNNYLNVRDIGNLEEIAFDIGFAENGSLLPMNFVPDLQKASELIEHGEGKITKFGIIYKIGDRHSIRYNSNNLPVFLDRYNDGIAGIQLFNKNWSEEEIASKDVFLPLPTSSYEIQNTVMRSGIPDEDIAFNFVSEIYESDSLFKILNECKDIYLIADFYDSAKDLLDSESGIKRFDAIVSYAEAKDINELKILVENNDDFYLIEEVNCPEDYGKHQFFQEFEISNPDLKDMLNDYFDFEEYISFNISKEQGQFTEYGYVGYQGEAPSMDHLLGRNQTNQIRM